MVARLRRLPADSGRRPRIALYPKGYHMLLRDLEAATVRDDIVAWIADPAAPLPSGGDALAAQVMATDDDSLKAELPAIAGQ